MKKSILVAFLNLLIIPLSMAQTTLLTEDFETDGEGSRYTSSTFSNCDNSDYFLRTDDNGPFNSCGSFGNVLSNVQGNWFWVSEDIDSPDNPNSTYSTLALNPLNASGYSSITISLYMATGQSDGTRWELDDFVRIQAKWDAGTFVTIGQFVGDAEFGGYLREDTNLDGIADGGAPVITTTFTNYTFNVPGIGTNLTVRILLDGHDGSEEFAFDKFVVQGSSTPPSNFAPILANIENTPIIYTEGDAPTVVTNSLTITDPDDTQLESAEVQICSGFNSAEDVLSFTPVGGITGSYSVATGILTLSGTSTVANYQTALRSIKYENTNTNNPSNTKREVCFKVNDGTDVSNIQSRFIGIMDVISELVCTPFVESFESDGEGISFVSNTFDDSPSPDFFFRTNTKPAGHAESVSGIDGSYFWASEDIKGGSNGNVDGIIEFAPLIITGKDNFTFQMLIGTSNSDGTRWETTDNIEIQYNIDGGGWNTFGLFQGDDPFGGNLRVDTDNDPATSGPYGTTVTNGTASDISFGFNGTTGDELKLRIVFDQAGGSEELVIDNIRFDGIYTTPPIEITAQPENETVCPDGSAVFSVSATGTGLIYQWQENDGGGFADLTDGGNVSGATTSSLSLAAASVAMDGNQYKVIISSSNGCGFQIISDAATLGFYSNSTPPALNATNNTICYGESTTINANGGQGSPDAELYWYSGPNGTGNLIQIGSPLIQNYFATETIYARWEGGCNTSDDAVITINVNTESTPLTTLSANYNAICPGESVDLQASGGIDGTGAQIVWYDGPNGTGNMLGTGSGITVTPATTTTYYARREGTCNTTSDVDITITVKTLSTPLTTVGGNLNVCENSSTTLIVYGGISGTGSQIAWYKGISTDPADFLGYGATQVVGPDIATSYTVRREGDCNTTAPAYLNLNVLYESTALTTITASENSICAGQSADLSASGGTDGTYAQIVWYDGPNGTGNMLGTGPGITVTPATTTTYYARKEGTCNTTDDVSITITVKILSTPLTTVGGDLNVCENSSTTLTVFGGIDGTGSQIVWYKGIGVDPANIFGYGATQTVSPGIATSYTVRREGDCNTTAATYLSLNVQYESTALTTISASTNTVCAGQSSDLSASGGTAGTNAQIVWYDGLNGTGNMLGSGPGITVTPATTTTYYARREGTCNVTSDVMITIEVDKIAPVISGCPTNDIDILYTDAGQCYYTASGNEFDISATDNNSAVVALSYKLTGATIADGSTSLSGVQFNYGTTTVVWTATDDCGNSSTCEFDVNVLNIKTNTTVTVSPTPQQYSDLVEFEATIEPWNCLSGQPGDVVFYIGTQAMGAPVAIGTDGKAKATYPLVEIPSHPSSRQMSPGVKTVTADFMNTNPAYSISDPTTDLAITPEDANVEYAGVEFQATAGSNSSEATVELRAVLQSVPDEPDARGDIRNACVSIEINGSIVVSGLHPALINPTDSTVGVVILPWVFDIGSADYESYDVRVIADCYFVGENQTVVTVYKPVGDFITGGGHIKPTNSAGRYASTPGLKTNFGFHVKFNKKGKNLQGGMNIIFRQLVGGEVQLFQIKTNAMSSLGINIANPDEQIAEFISKANLKNLTTGEGYGGNLTLQVKIIDRGEPGTNDEIAITLWDGGTLLYSSEWNGLNTDLQYLVSGNTVIHAGFSLKDAEITTGITDVVDFFNVNLYPNPSTGEVNLKIHSSEIMDSEVIVRSITGSEIFKKKYQASEQIKFVLSNQVSGIYLISLTQGEHSVIKKLILDRK